MTSLAVSISIWLVVAGATVAALSFRRDAMLAPLVIGGAAILVSSIDVFRTARGHWRSRAGAGGATQENPSSAIDAEVGSTREQTIGQPEADKDLHSVLASFGWLTLFSVLYWLAGAVIATLLFGPVFLRIQNRSRWWVIALVTLPSAIGLYVIIEALGLPEHEGLLRERVAAWLAGGE